jgi:hypothetical protein
MYDPRAGRFFAIDPLTQKYPWYTPYQFAGNKVIQFVELEGMEEAISQSNSTTIDNKSQKATLLDEVIIQKTTKKPSFWKKAGAFAKGFATAVVVTTAVVVVVALVATTGPVGAIIATGIGDSLLAVGVVSIANSTHTVVTGEDYMTGKKVSELERWEEGGSIIGGIVGIGAGSKMSNSMGISETGSPELTEDNTITPESETYFRGDLRIPEQIFLDGFNAKGDNYSLVDHVLNNPGDSAFISTSKDITVTVEFGDFAYEINTRLEGRDVNSEFNKNPNSNENEIAFPDHIPSVDIKGAYPVNNDGSLGDFIPNPNYKSN